MPSEDERDSSRNRLTKRDEYLSWKRKSRLVAMDKGDVYGLFDEDGTKGIYAALPGGAGAAAARSKWAKLARQLVGTIGKTIENESLQETWSREYERVIAQGAGPPDERPFVVALCMAAVERECSRAGTVGASIARTEFVIALQSFTEDDQKKSNHDTNSVRAGFIPYADRVRSAERKLAALGIPMTDDEKKQQFFQYFTGTHTETWRTSLSN
jgi:hypothetical protein